MKLKPGVRVAGLRAELVLAAIVADQLWRSVAGTELTITSALDGSHMRASLHYSGRALDLRTRDLRPDLAVQLRALLAEALGAEFDVVLESDHIHVELDPHGALARPAGPPPPASGPADPA